MKRLIALVLGVIVGASLVLAILRPQVYMLVI